MRLAGRRAGRADNFPNHAVAGHAPYCCQAAPPRPAGCAGPRAGMGCIGAHSARRRLACPRPLTFPKARRPGELDVSAARL
jgi:hypothetical protein